MFSFQDCCLLDVLQASVALFWGKSNDLSWFNILIFLLNVVLIDIYSKTGIL